ncbi:transposase, partial [Xanthomonas vasicola]
GQRASGAHGPEPAVGHDRQCDADRCTQLDQDADHARDPEMHQTKKGNQWSFGMKAHIGVDEFSGLVHHVHCTAANVADVTVMHTLL